MYSAITSNKRKTALFILIFILVLLGLGWLLGELYGQGFGYGGIVIAAMVSLIMSLTGYFKGDAIALAAAGAKQIKKEEAPYVYRMAENLAITAGLPMPKVYIIEDQAINAFATGRDPKHASIAVTTGAIQKLANEELEGVLAHELSHVKNYDIRIMTVVIVLVGIVVLIADWMFRMQWHGGGRSRRESGGLVVVLALVVIILAPLVAQLIKLAVSRKREYLADAAGVLLTRFPEGLARALEKIGREAAPLRRANHATAHLFIASPFGERLGKAASTLFATHPPIENRIKTLRAMGT